MFEAVEGMRGRARRPRAPARRAPRPTPTSAWPSGSTSATPSCRRSSRPGGSGGQLGEDIEAARELVAEDPAFAEEAESSPPAVSSPERLRRLLVPRDPADAKDALLEIKSGEGGEESALFAGDLLRMYSRYAERRGWSVEVLDATDSDLGGYKSVTVAVKAKGTVEPGEAPYALLKFEGGVHRVQRVPVTESQGRVHTSAAGVLVMPEAEQVDVEIDDNDLRIDVYRRRAPAASASTPPTRRSASPTCPPASWPAARTRRASCRTRSRRCGSCVPGCCRPPRTPPTPRPARPAAPGAHGRPLRADPHLQLPGEPHLRPPHRLQVLQPRPGARRGPRSRSSTPASRPTWPPGSRPSRR